MERQKKLAFIFAHPDDELVCSGYMMQLKQHEIYCVTATRGEAGRRQNDSKSDSRPLEEIRTEEFKQVCKVLNTQPVQWFYKDSGSTTWIKEGIHDKMKNFILNHKIDHVITFDSTGGNHHPDHKMISQVVTDVIVSMTDVELTYLMPFSRKDIKKKLWFLPVQPKIITKMTVADDAIDFRLKLTKAEKSLKLKLMQMYNSQFPDQKGRYYKLPLWLIKGLLGYEYYKNVIVTKD